jgi:hypothetical protein
VSATPGPWVVNRGEFAHITNHFYKGIVALISHNERGPLMVVNPNDHATTEQEWDANAHLIAAAPLMRDALALAWEWIGKPAADRPAKVDAAILAALAAAEGK